MDRRNFDKHSLSRFRRSGCSATNNLRMLQVFSTRPCTETKSPASVPWTVSRKRPSRHSQEPNCTQFYQLALLDGLSFDAKTNMYGPDGSVKRVLSSKDTDEYTENLQEAAFALVAAEKALKMKTVTIADAVAIGGAEAIESIGGPVLTVGRRCGSVFRLVPANRPFAIDRRPKWRAFKRAIDRA
jgi:hypothetical protein